MLAILAGIAAMLAMELGFSLEWYWALSLGALVYFVIRYIGSRLRQTARS